MYRFILRGFDKEPTQADVDSYGQIICIEGRGTAHSMYYTEEGGWNTFHSVFDGKVNGDCITVGDMKRGFKGWLQKYEVSEENWYDQIMTIIEEAQLLQREYEGEQRNDDKSDALDELVAILDQAKDFAEVFS